MATAFGLPNDTPAFGYMRLGGFVAVLVGVFLELGDGSEPVSSTILVVGIIMVLIGLFLTWQQRRRREFDRRLDQYEAGERDDLPE